MAEQLTYGDSKTPFYPLIENGITLIELNSSITDLVTSSSPEDIEQAFDGVENFDNLITALRLSGTVINGITIATDTEAGNMTADVIVSKNENKVVIRWIDENYQYVLTVTKSAEGTFSCTKTSLLLGSEVDLSNYLSKTNTTSYTPTANYNPATKKYVDDNIVASFNIVSTDGTTASFSQENYNKLVEAITNNQNIIIVYLDNSNNTTKSLVSSAVNSEGNITLKTHSINNENGDITYNEFVILGSTFTNNVTINSKTFQIESGVQSIVSNGTYMLSGEVTNNSFTFNDTISDSSLGDIHLAIFPIIGNVVFTFIRTSENQFMLSSNTIRISNSIINYNGATSGSTLYQVTGNITNSSELSITFTAIECTLSESEYSALGDIVNNDNVIYHIIPDA